VYKQDLDMEIDYFTDRQPLHENFRENEWLIIIGAREYKERFRIPERTTTAEELTLIEKAFFTLITKIKQSYL
jgi:hypothetical protein